VKANKTMKVQAVPNHRIRKGKKGESNIDLSAHHQSLKQQQLQDRDHHIPINTNTK
jgi:tRNA nucleotidyltransferase (CCA-adding enzyme)